MEYEHTITFRLDKPTKPYWEKLGYKTYQDYESALHYLYIDKDDKYHCYSCGDKECPCLTKRT
jgi:hypothetical protein